jgi:uncharacterized protein YndB with AHSA1/START domain
VNPDLDLVLERIIRAPRATVWRAWTTPSRLEQWWVPAPSRCRVDRLDLWPGGAFVTRLSDDGAEFVSHLDGCFLAVDELERIVFTTAVDSAWRPAGPAPVLMTATITLNDHPDGTERRQPDGQPRTALLRRDEAWGQQPHRVGAVTYGPEGIRVNAIAPGNTLTEMIRTWEADSPGLVERLKARTPLRRAADPDEIAQAAAWLLSDRSSYVTGTVLRVDGGARA